MAADPRREHAREAAASTAAALLEMPAYRPLSVWRRVFVGLLGLGTAWGVVMSLVSEPGGVKRAQHEAAQRAAAASTPASTAASAAASAASVASTTRAAAPPREATVMPVMVIPAASAPR